MCNYDFKKKKLGSTEDLSFTSRIKNAESDYFPPFCTQQVITCRVWKHTQQVNWDVKSANLPILNSLKEVKTKFTKIKSTWIICTSTELWFKKKNWGQLRILFLLSAFLTQQVKRNSPISPRKTKKNLKIFWGVNLWPRYFRFMKKARAQKFHAVPLTFLWSLSNLYK